MAIVLADNTPRIEYTVAQGVTQTVFPIPFVFFNKEDSSNVDVKVFVDGVERTLGSISTTTFSITSGGNGAKGSLSTTVTGASGGSTVIVLRDTKIGRTTDFPSGGAFEVSKLNTELDTLVAIEGDFEDHVSRSIRLQDKDTAVSLALPLKADRLGKQLGFNATTGAVEMFTPESLAIASDSGSSSVDLTSNTFTFTGGEGIDTSISNQTLTITGELASTSNKGVASFNSTNFTVSSGVVTANDITLASDSGSATNTLGETFTLSGGTGLTTSATGSTVTMNVDAAQTGITSLLATDIKIGEDNETKIDFETADQINFYANNVNVVQLSNTNSGDAVFTVPTSDKDFVIKGNDGGSTITALTIDMSNSGDASFNNNVTVGGNLTVNGSSTTVNTATLTVEDPLISLASGNNSADSVDVGFYGLYDTTGSQDLYAGLFRDASDSGKFKLFKDLQVEPTTTVNTSGTGYAVGTLVANLEGTIQTASQTNITSVGTLTGLTIDGDTTFTGANYNAVWDKANSLLEFKDNAKATFGNDSDLRISHDGSNSFITEAGTGGLFIGGNALVQIHKAGSSEKMIEANADGNVELYYDNSLKLQTTSGGIEVTGTVTDDGAIHDGDVTFTGTNGNIVFDKSDDRLEFADGVQARFGNGADFSIAHDNDRAEFFNYTGDVIIRNNANDKDIVLQSDSGGGGISQYFRAVGATGEAKMYHYGSEKITTTSTGATVTGELTADGAIFGDSDRAKFGNSNDLNVYHENGFSVIRDNNSQPIYIQTNNTIHITKNGAIETMAKFISDGAVELYHNNVKMLQTETNGITIGDAVGILQINSTNNTIGTTVAGVHLYGKSFRERGFSIFNDSLGESNLVEEWFMGVCYGDNNQPFVIKSNDQNETALKINQLGSVELYHNNARKMQTFAGGIVVSSDNIGASYSSDVEGIIIKSALADSATDENISFRVETSPDGGTSDKAFDIVQVTNGNAGGTDIQVRLGNRFTNNATPSEIVLDSSDASITADNINLIKGSNSKLKFTSPDGSSEGYQIRANVSDVADFGLLIEDLDGNDIAKFLDGGAVELYHNHVKKFETTSDGVIVTSTDADANEDPSLILYRNSASPADGDDLGNITFRGRNDNSQDVDYIELVTDITDASDGSESAQLLIKAFENGTLTQYASFNGGGGQIYFSRKLNMQSNQILGVSNIQFSGTHGSDSNTQIKTEQSINQQTSLVLQTGDDATTNNEDDVRIRHRNYGNATPTDLDMAIFKRNVSDNSKADITFNGDLKLLSTDAGATAGPTLSLYRNSASPATNDDIGQIQWFAENDNDEKIEYARIDVRNSGVTDGQEYGQMDFMYRQFGAEMVAFRLSFGLAQFYNHVYIGSPFNIIFEGDAYNDFETTLTRSGPTADRTITLPDLTGTVALTSQLSDIRDKKDVEDLQLGLDFVNAMRPVQFTWDRRDGSYNDVKELGFIAQELDQVERQFDTKERTKLVTEMSEDELHVSPMNSYPILVKAIQELSAQVESLQARVKELEG